MPSGLHRQRRTAVDRGRSARPGAERFPGAEPASPERARSSTRRADVAAQTLRRPVDLRRGARRPGAGRSRRSGPVAQTLSTRPPAATSSPSLHRRAGVEDLDARHARGARRCRVIGSPLHRPLRVAGARQHDARRAPPCGSRGAERSKPPRRAGEQHRQQVVLEPQQERLRLGVAEAGVELEHPRPVGGQHQAGVEDADERPVLGREPGQRRPHHALEHLGGLGPRSARPTGCVPPCRRCSGPVSPSPSRL